VSICYTTTRHVARNPAEGKTSPRTGRKALQKGFKQLYCKLYLFKDSGITVYQIEHHYWKILQVHIEYASLQELYGMLLYIFISDVGYCFTGNKSKSPYNILKYLLQCKPVLEYILDNNIPESSASTEDSTLPTKMLNLLTHKLRQYLKELVAIHVKKR